MKALNTTEPRRSHLGRIAAALLASLLLGRPSEAQIPTGNILGTVKDSTAGAVPGATVTATNNGTQYARSATTDSTGQYALRLLPVGNYTLVVSIPGFKTGGGQSNIPGNAGAASVLKTPDMTEIFIISS